MPVSKSTPSASALSQHRIQAGRYCRLDLSAAQRMVPMLHTITRRAALELNPLQQKLNSMVPADPRNPAVRQAYEQVVRQWAGKVERLGLKVHGLWQVGFDGGHGWFGWQFPERSIRYFLEYEALFSERRPLREHLQEQERMSRR